MRKTVVLLAALLFLGCAVSPAKAEELAKDYGPYPKGYKQIIKDNFSKRLSDPYSAVYTFRNPKRGRNAVYELYELYRLGGSDEINKFEFDTRTNMELYLLFGLYKVKESDWLKFGWIVCGTVNAKNKMGGYVGAQPFYAVIRNNVVLNIFEDTVFTEAFCPK